MSFFSTSFSHDVIDVSYDLLKRSSVVMRQLLISHLKPSLMLIMFICDMTS
jgi:hypothetical protein